MSDSSTSVSGGSPSIFVPGRDSSPPSGTSVKWTTVAAIIAGIIGIILIGLGGSKAFGSEGSLFIGLLAGGGALTAIAGVILLGIAIANCRKREASSGGAAAAADPDEVLRKARGEEEANIKARLEYPAIGQAAIAFARQKLKEHPALTSARGARETHQPHNPEIALLRTLFWDVCFPAFENAIKKYGDNAWSQEEVIKAADDLMKVGYAVSCLTLEDLPEFIMDLRAKGMDRTFTEALVRQDSYQYRTFFFCPRAYHWIRGGILWCKPEHMDEAGLFHSNDKKPSEAFVALFAQAGTRHSDWEALYKDYCRRVRLYVKEEDLSRGDTRHANWTRQYGPDHEFYHRPDTLPT